MIKLRNVEGQIELELSIMGYAYPDLLHEDWLLVKTSIRHYKRNFEVVEVCLEAFEILTLLEWFKCLAEFRLPRYANLCFTDTYFEFHFLACREEKIRISVVLSGDVKPPFRIKQFQRRTNDWSIVCELSPTDFAEIIQGIEKAIEAFPSRVPHNLG